MMYNNVVPMYLCCCCQTVKAEISLKAADDMRLRCTSCFLIDFIFCALHKYTCNYLSHVISFTSN